MILVIAFFAGVRVFGRTSTTNSDGYPDPETDRERAKKGLQTLHKHLNTCWKNESIHIASRAACTEIATSIFEHDRGSFKFQGYLISLSIKDSYTLKELDDPTSDYSSIVATIAKCVRESGHLDLVAWRLWKDDATAAPFYLLNSFIKKNEHAIINLKYVIHFFRIAGQAVPSLFDLMCQTPDEKIRPHASKIISTLFKFCGDNRQLLTIDFDKYSSYDHFVKIERKRFLVSPEDIVSPRTGVSRRTDHFNAIISEISNDLPYEQLSELLLELSHAFRMHVAKRLESALNAQARAMPHDKLEGKKSVAEFVNNEAERFGLSVKCPNSGLPAKLKATAGNWPGAGRFHFEVYINGKREKPSVSDTLPDLSLIDANPTREAELDWKRKVEAGPRRGGPRFP